MRRQTSSLKLTGYVAMCIHIITLSTAAEALLEAPFTRITEGEIAKEKYTSECAAWGDYNNDGWLDILVGNDIDNSSLFRNNKDGTFTKTVSELVPSTNFFGFHAAAWADYDNDGFLDLTVAEFFWWRSPIFHNNGQGKLIELAPEVSGEILGPGGHDAVAWADYDSDGLLDLFVGRGGFEGLVSDFLYHNNGSNFSNVVNAVTTPRLPTMQGTWSDYDNDGDMDLLVTHYGDRGNSLFRNEGKGVFTDVSESAGLTARAGSAGSAWGDYDNDGDLDLLITNYRNTGGPPTRNFLYENNGDGTFAPITEGAIASAQGYFVSCSWIDYDNDGWLDLFITDQGAEFLTGGRKLLFRNLSGAGFAETTVGDLPADRLNAAGFSWGDYNNDGFLDLFVANGGLYGDQVNSLYRNNTNDNSWIKLTCIGTQSNRSAIGTKVRVKAKIGGEDRWQMRQIVGTEGYLTFNALDVLVGLGDATKIDIIRFEWPSGLVEEMRDVPVKQTLTILEGSIGREGPLEAPFTRIVEGEITTEKYTSEAAAWGDYDSDGWLDLLVGNDVGNSSLFRNNKDGTFARVSSGPLASTNRFGFHAAAWADYDNDGLLDLTVAQLFSGESPFFRNDGQGNFIRLLPDDSGEVVDRRFHAAVAWADYDSDGLLDLFVGRGAFLGAPGDFLYHNNGNKFSNVVNVVTTARFNTTQGTWADYDNDGDIDLFVTHYLEQGNSLYQNDGKGSFANVTQSARLTDRARSVGSAWGDFDNDGDLDLIVTNLRDPSGPATRNFFYLNQGDGTFSRITNSIVASEPGWFLSCAWVDYDNDGWLDLFLTGDGPGFLKGHNYLYRNIGGGSFIAVTNGVLVTDGANPAGCAWGDYNNDGFADVFVANGGLSDPQLNSLYRNNTNGNSWIKLKCVGTRSNRSAIGTKVRVKATISGEERWQMRHIVGTEGWLSFNALDVLVGLGDATKIDIIRFEWPSGEVEELRDISVKQTLTIVEGSINLGPRLEIGRTTDGSVLLTWANADYLLESTAALASPSSWTPVLPVAGTSHRVSPEGSRFFRLKQR